MKSKLVLFSIIFTLLSVAGITMAQNNVCEANKMDLATIVSTTCASVGENEVCYGNLLVNLIPQVETPNLHFSRPGDRADVNNVRSLFLSELNSSEDLWGIAQMRLLAITPQGAQDVVLLLFGDVQVDNEVASRESILINTLSSANIRSTPNSRGTILGSVEEGIVIDAVARLYDTSWIRVYIEESDILGWIATELIATEDENADLETLPIQSGSDPYLGAMQAMSLVTGESPNCANFATDGLLVQTPSGTARVSLLINEVTIELIPSSTLGATAFIQSNPARGLSVNMIDGSSFVSTNQGSYYVGAGSSTNVPLDANSSPTGAPSVPASFDESLLDTVTLLGTVRDANAPISEPITVIDVPTSGATTTTTTTTTNGNRNGNGNANGQGNGNGQGNSTRTNTNNGSGGNGNGSGGNGNGSGGNTTSNANGSGGNANGSNNNP